MQKPLNMLIYGSVKRHLPKAVCGFELRLIAGFYAPNCYFYKVKMGLRAAAGFLLAIKYLLPRHPERSFVIWIMA
jgi:hypothetical protein